MTGGLKRGSLSLDVCVSGYPLTTSERESLLACCGRFPVGVLSSQSDTIRRFPYLDQERQAAMLGGVIRGLFVENTHDNTASEENVQWRANGAMQEGRRAGLENGKKEATASEKSR
ncbi:hypothetical protein EYF80_015707 [Liparis tanakae]|uniref:Uncharacterized protein n=1 Tax=Liparis tanakae TaxID=230148 RepID=A0A4Z2I7P3_9TELE|nr:hypothetical protein EYF80_015707 [Liparis tanakae]